MATDSLERAGAADRAGGLMTIGGGLASAGGQIGGALAGSMAASAAIPVIGWGVAALAAIGAGIAKGVRRKRMREAATDSVNKSVADTAKARARAASEFNIENEQRMKSAALDKRQTLMDMGDVERKMSKAKEDFATKRDEGIVSGMKKNLAVDLGQRSVL